MRTKLDKMLCEAYQTMMSNDKSVKTITESQNTLEKQAARTDKTYSSIMESYNGLVNQTRLDEATYFDFVKNFIKSKNWKYTNKAGDEVDMPGIVAQKDPAKKKAIADAWAAQKSKANEEKTIEENNIMERAAQIKAKNDKMSWVEAKKKAQAEIDSQKEADKEPEVETDEKPLEEDAGSINPPKDLKADVEKLKKVKKEEETDDKDDEEVEESKKEEDTLEEDAGSINPPKDLKADVEKLKKVKKEEEKEENVKECKKSFKEIAEEFLRETEDDFDDEEDEDKKKLLIKLNKKVELPKGYGSSQSSKYWPVKEIIDIISPSADYNGKHLKLNSAIEDMKTTNKDYQFKIDKTEDFNKEEFIKKIKNIYFDYLTAKRKKADKIFGSETPNPVDALKSEDEKIDVIKKIISVE